MHREAAIEFHRISDVKTVGRIVYTPDLAKLRTDRSHPQIISALSDRLPTLIHVPLVRVSPLRDVDDVYLPLTCAG